MGPSSSKVIQNKATRPDHQPYDRVEIGTDIRWKESELSGDEYRISAHADLFYKDHLIKRMSFNSVEDAIRYLDGALVYWRENGDSFDRADDSYRCDQEGCSQIADVKYKRLDAWTDRGEKEKLYDFNLYRVFCNKHKGRGDCALDDADRNYEQVEFTPEETKALEELKQKEEEA